MNALDDQKRKDAVQALINIVILETVLIIAVIVLFFVTKEISYLVFGVAGVALITGPMFWRWFKGPGKALRAPVKNDD